MNLARRRELKAQAAEEIDSLLAHGARYVLVYSEPNFMAIKNDGTCIEGVENADAFLSDLEPSRREQAMDELLTKAAAQPQHLAIILGVY